MPSHGHLALLRRRLAALRSPHTGISLAAPSRQPRSAAVPQRQLASHTYAGTATSLVLPPSPSFPSSSRLTLDALDALDGGGGAAFDLTSYAHDEELLSALLAPRRAPSWLDPAQAYLGLRNSGLFTHHLSTLAPHAAAVYASLRPAGVHALLVSDLLLRHPDAAALRAILDAEATAAIADKAGPAPGADAHPPVAAAAAPSRRLRASLTAQAHAIIRPYLASRALAPLARPTNLLVARALMAADTHLSLSALLDVYWALVAQTTWTPESAWPLLRIIVHVARHSPDEAARALQYPLALGKLPAAATAGRSSAAHPRAKELAIGAVALRTALAWGMHARARVSADGVFGVLAASGRPAPHTTALLLQTARAMIGTGERAGVDWAGDLLGRLAAVAPVPATTLDLYIAALPPRKSAVALLRFHGAGVAPATALRAAEALPSRAVLAAALPSMLSEHAASQQAAFLRLLARARLGRLVRELWPVYVEHADGRALDGDLVVDIIRAAAREPDADRAFAMRVLHTYTGAPAPRPSSDPAAALHAMLLLDQRAPDALVSAVLARDDADAALDRIVSLSPRLLAAVRRAVPSYVPDPTLVVAAACARGQWSALTGLSAPPPSDSLAAADARFVRALRAARQNKMTRARRFFIDACEQGGASRLAAPTAAAVLRRCRSNARWDEGVQVWAAAAAAGAADDVDDAGAALLRAWRAAGAPTLGADAAEAVGRAVMRLGPGRGEAFGALLRDGVEVAAGVDEHGAGAAAIE